MREPSSAAWSLLALGWALLVWGLLTATTIPGEALVSAWMPVGLRPWQDKAAHGALFLVQALLVDRAGVARLGRWRALLVAVGCCVALGMATELRQRSLPSRDADLGDFAADTVGAFAYALAMPLSRWRARARTGP